MKTYYFYQILFRLTSLAATFGVVLLGISLFDPTAGELTSRAKSFAIGVAMCVPFAFVYWMNSRSKKNGKKELDRLASELGANESEWGLRSGIAIAEHGSKLVLSQDGKIKTYDFSDISKWKVYNPFATDLAITAIGDGWSSEAWRYKNVGIGITVSDADHPDWHVRIHNGNALDRWNAILTRCFENRRGT